MPRCRAGVLPCRFPAPAFSSPVPADGALNIPHRGRAASYGDRTTTTTYVANGGRESVVDFHTRNLQACAHSTDLSYGRSLHAALLKSALLSSLFLHNHLLNMYFRCWDLSSARQLFDQMPDRNVVSWSAAISGFVRCDQPRLALRWYSRMLSSQRPDRVRPNEFTLVGTLNACALAVADGCCHTIACQVYAHVVKLGFEPNVFLFNAFLTATLRSGKLAEAVELFDKSCRVRDVVTWNSMFTGLLELPYTEVWRFWCRMLRDGTPPDEYTFSTVFNVLAQVGGLNYGKRVHAQLLKSGHGDDMCVGDSLVNMYLSNKAFHQGWKVFEELAWKDVVSWTQMAFGCLQSGQPSKALQLLKSMMQAGVTPNKYTLATGFNACATLVSLEEGRKLHGLRIKSRSEVIDACVDNALIDMYAKCGCVDAAGMVFRSMKGRRCVTSWTTMIMGYAQNGLARHALTTFDEMLSRKVEPNNITFVCVLYACSQGGFVDEGWRHFWSMCDDHGMVPEEDHYVCMVDLLGRAGQITEAEDFIRRMPFEPGPLVWQTLLGACRLHGDVETGRRAAELAISKDRRDHSTYVLLSNMLATSRQWDGVGEVRKLMEDRAIERIHGRSWMEY